MENKQKVFSTREAISFGWDKVNDHLGFFIPATICLIILVLGLDFFANKIKDIMPLVETLLQIASTIVNVIVTLGFIKLSLSVYDGVKPSVSIIFSQTKYFFRYFFASVLYGLIVLGGMLLLVIPGIIWAIRFRYFGYAIVAKDMKIIESLKESRRLTKGLTWKLFVFSLALFGINLLGLIPAGVGLLVTIPISIIAVGYVWRKINDSHTEAVIIQPKELEVATDTVA